MAKDKTTKKDHPSKQTIEAVSKLIARASIASVRVWLQSRDLPHTAPSRKKLETLLAGLIETGELKKSELENAIIGIEESGGKRIMFFDLLPKPSGPSSMTDIISGLTKAEITVSNEPALAPAHAKQGKLVYVTAHGNVLRLKWAEMHQAPVVDLNDDTITWDDVRKVIVLEADLTAKRAEIRFDKPEKKHPHETGIGSQNSYYEAYRQKAEVILGYTLQPTELRPALKSLLESVPRVVKVHIEEHTNARRMRVKYVARSGDVRDDPEWSQPHTVGGSSWAYDAPSFDWLTGPSSGTLKREFFSHADAATSTLRVLADCNEHEVKYAIHEIRSRQGGSSNPSPASGGTGLVHP